VLDVRNRTPSDRAAVDTAVLPPGPVKMPPYHWWRTVFFLIPAISVFTIVLGTISLLSSLIDRSGDTGHRCARAWAWLILKTTGVRVEAHGLEKLDPKQSYVFASNHQSIYDIPIVFASLPLQLRIIAKDSLGKFPFLGWHLQRTGHLLVDRKNPGAGILKKMARLISGARSLIVFPEGTRSVDGTVARFKGGMFLLAIDSDLPVVPVSIAGSRHVMLKGRLMTCPGEVTLTVHDPIPTAGIGRDGARELAERVREIVSRNVDQPFDKAQGRPASSPV
jgi:1-acyl-sn-glycerol-3-phosphate acyltransferase